MTTSTLWFVCALIALGTEFLTGTLYLLVFAVALAGGGIAALQGTTNTNQFLAASLAGLVALAAVTAWKRRRPPRAPQTQDDPDIGQSVSVLTIDHNDPNQARVFYRGAQWDARLIAPLPAAGHPAIIVGRDGNLLHVSAHPTESHS